LGTPNACTGCHTEQSDEWATTQVVEWYGSEHEKHWAHTFAASAGGGVATGTDLVEIAGDVNLPPIVRATALGLLRAYGPPTLVAAFNGLKDPDPLVRTLSVAGFDRLPPTARVSLVADHLNDASRAVRVEAARVMAEVPAEALSAEQQRDLKAALAEFGEAQRAQGDQPSAHLNMGVVQTARGQNDRAERSYRAALRMDPDFLPARANLVQLYDQMGRSAEAEKLLREGIARSPEEGELYYSLGLLLAQEKRLTDAAEALAAAAERMPDRARVHYNLGIARQHLGQMREAEAALVRAREIAPGDAGIARTLAALYLEQGDRKRARIHAKAALYLAPNDPRVQQLMREIDGEEPPAPSGS
jgi:Flp pilus assembly protein TadD